MITVLGDGPVAIISAPGNIRKGGGLVPAYMPVYCLPALPYNPNGTIDVLHRFHSGFIKQKPGVAGQKGAEHSDIDAILHGLEYESGHLLNPDATMSPLSPYIYFKAHGLTSFRDKNYIRYAYNPYGILVQDKYAGAPWDGDANGSITDVCLNGGKSGMPYGVDIIYPYYGHASQIDRNASIICQKIASLTPTFVRIQYTYIRYDVSKFVSSSRTSLSGKTYQNVIEWQEGEITFTHLFAHGGRNDLIHPFVIENDDARGAYWSVRHSFHNWMGYHPYSNAPDRVTESRGVRVNTAALLRYNYIGAKCHSFTRPNARSFREIDDQYRRAAKKSFKPSKMKDARDEALSNVSSWDTNNIENLTQASSLFQILNPVHDLASLIWAGKNPLRALAQCYLTYKYAVAPTAKDAVWAQANLVKLIKNLNNHFRGHSGRARIFDNSSIPTTYYAVLYRLRLNDTWIAKTVDTVGRLGVLPTEDNLWDLVPFSFIVDWFVPVGEVLKKKVNRQTVIGHKQVIFRIQTFKYQRVIHDLDRYHPVGNVVYRYYRRDVDDQLGIQIGDPITAKAPGAKKKIWQALALLFGSKK